MPSLANAENITPQLSGAVAGASTIQGSGIIPQYGGPYTCERLCLVLTNMLTDFLLRLCSGGLHCDCIERQLELQYSRIDYCQLHHLCPQQYAGGQRGRVTITHLVLCCRKLTNHPAV